jgi:hypothetical protein
MALDMYANGKHEAIYTNEEFIFSLAQADEDRYPELLSLWSDFYNSPRIPSTQAGILLHEIIELLSRNGGFENKLLASIVFRLLQFLSMADRGGHEIKTKSD